MKTKAIVILAALFMLTTVPSEARRNEFREMKQDKNVTYLHMPSLVTSSFSSRNIRISEETMTKVKGMRIIQADNSKGAAHVDKWFRKYIDGQKAEPLTQIAQGGDNVEIYLLDTGKKASRLVIYTQSKEESCVLIIRGKVDISQLNFN